MPGNSKDTTMVSCCQTAAICAKIGATIGTGASPGGTAVGAALGAIGGFVLAMGAVAVHAMSKSIPRSPIYKSNQPGNQPASGPAKVDNSSKFRPSM